MPIPRESSSGADHKAKTRLERLLLNLEQAWNRGDAEAYAAFFTEDAIYVSRGGAVWERREEIRRQLTLAFSGPLRYTILHFRAWRIRFLTDKIAIVYTAMDIVNPWNNALSTQMLASLVCDLAYDDWRVTSAHATDRT